MSTFKMVALGIAVFAIIAVVWLSSELWERNDDQNFQIVQSVGGTMTCKDTAGWYWKGFAEVTTYPRVMRAYYSSEKDEGEETKDQSISVTFNDGGTADINSFIQFRLPTKEVERLELHRTFGGNPKNIKIAVRAHLVNCLKNTSPLMSGSEHQSARKGEFNQHVENQMKTGLYVTQQVSKETGMKNKDGSSIMILATAIVRVKGVAVIAQKSPLKTYSITIEQFSITKTKYDPQTLLQFAAKKNAILEMEKAKAERSKFEQQKLEIEARGLAELAEVQAESNKKKATAVIAAELKAEVALQAKIEAITKAEMLVEIAKQDKLEAETQAAKLLAVAKLLKQAATEDAAAIKILAIAQEEKIKKAGAITEEKKVLAQIAAARDVEVAEALAKVHVPSVVFNGGSGGSFEQNHTMQLLNIKLLQSMGVIGSFNSIVKTEPVKKK